MKVAIEARLPDPKASGGVSQAIISLASALSGLRDCRQDEEFVFIVRASAGPWLDPHVSGPCRLHRISPSWKKRLGALPGGNLLRAMAQKARALQPPPQPVIAASDGLAESLGADIIHFPTQEGYLTSLPSIYQPHDLQHLHLPEYFPADELAWRTLAYPAYCNKADCVLVESSWTKDDVARQYGIAPEKIAVCPFPPATGGYREPDAMEVSALKGKLRHQDFIFYPANTWPHKNHLRLIEALALLRREGLIVPLVCTGRTTAFLSEIEAAIGGHGLGSQILFMGYMEESEIKALYRLCRAVVVPTKFESVSFPVWEAFQAEKPVACSNVTALPGQVGQAGLLFGPDDVPAIAAAVRALWQNAGLREDLGRRGAARLAEFSLDRMALHMRALYRKLAGSMDDGDRAVLAATPLI